jgi:hypothetical protein
MYICPRCKGNTGNVCFICGGTGRYAMDGGPEAARLREAILQLHLHLDLALADVETLKGKYLEAVAALPAELQTGPGSLADAVALLVSWSAPPVAMRVESITATDDPIEYLDK